MIYSYFSKIMLILAISWPVLGYSLDYNLGFSCRTTGNWTSDALGNTRKLLSAVQALKADERCRGIESIVKEIALANDQVSAFQQDRSATQDASIDQQKEYVSSILNSNQIPNHRGFMNLTASLHMDSAIKQIAKFTSGLSQRSLIDPFSYMTNRKELTSKIHSVVTKAMDILPSLDLCLVNQPNQGLALVSALLNLSSSVVTAGLANGAASGGNLIANFVTYLRQIALSITTL